MVLEFDERRFGMIKIIEDILAKFKQADLESQSCRHEIAVEIAKKVIANVLIRFFEAMDIRKIEAWEKDKES